MYLGMVTQFDPFRIDFLDPTPHLSQFHLHEMVSPFVVRSRAYWYTIRRNGQALGCPRAWAYVLPGSPTTVYFLRTSTDIDYAL